MIKKFGFAAVAFLLMTGFSPDGFSAAMSTFRCGTSLVSLGDTKAEVLSRCGEPNYIDSWEEERIQRDFSGPRDHDRYDNRNLQPFLVKEHVTVEEWTYNPGPHRFINYLRFENGRLRKIITGNYGY